MKQGTGFMKRSLAMLLVAIMVATNLSGLTLPVRATEDGSVTVSEGEIVAGNYDLTAAEKALLESGLLVGSSITYTAPSDSDLIQINTEEKTVTVGAYTDAHGNEWIPTEAFIVYNGGEEKVTLTNGKGQYAYAGNAFSVKATYVLTVSVEAALQETLLGAAAVLKQGVANLNTVAGQAGNLFILEQAMPTLVDLAANGVSTPMGPVTLKAECRYAINRLNAQMEANGGQLKLSTMIEELEESSKSDYMLNKGAAMQAEIASLVGDLQIVSQLLDELHSGLDIFVSNGWVDATVASQIKTLANITGDLADALEVVNADPWTAANSGTSIVVGTDYAKLDALINAIGETTNVTVKNPLFVASAEIQQNMSMFNVTVHVVLETVRNNAVTEYGRRTIVLTLPENATKDEISSAILESNIVKDSLQSWAGVYLPDHYYSSEDRLPEALTEDIEVVYTYSPVPYTVSINGEAAQYPYGYVLTLPTHPEEGKAYDYYMDGEYYPQGKTLVVTGDMVFTREEGKSYTAGNLLAIIAENYGTEKDAPNLNSGVLKIDEAIYYREPTQDELETLVQLSGNVLTVQTYDSAYNELQWIPYTYVVDGVAYYFEGATTVELPAEFEKVDVYYRLVLTNFTADDVQEILDLVKTLVDEAEGQKAYMDKFAENESYLKQLTKNMLNGLNGVIGGYSSENGGGLHADPTTNDELVAFYQNTIADLIKTCTASNGYLNLYNIIVNYNDANNGGLIYYYQNYEYVLAELDKLIVYLDAMLDGGDRQAALEKLMTENGYGDKVDVLDTLKTKLNNIKENLKPVNEVIDTSDTAKLSTLVKALTAAGSVEYTECDSPYIEMLPVTRIADKYAAIQIQVTVGGKTYVFDSDRVLKGGSLNQDQINALKAQIAEVVAGYNKYYSNNYDNGAELDALVGVELDSNMTFAYTWSAIEYVVHIPGENDQIVSIENLIITLPGHPNAANGMSYEYTIGDKTVGAGIYTFVAADLDALFVNGELTITRIEKSEAVEKLENMVDEINGTMGEGTLELITQNGSYTGVVANIGADNLMDLVMNLVMKSGYGYIGLNDAPFIYSNEKAELELSMQAMINALLNDSEFSSQALIEMGSNGGTLLNAKLQLGNSQDEVQYTGLDFAIVFEGNMGMVADALKSMENYLTFESNNGVLEFKLNLPDKVYGAYLTALVATGHLDKADANSIDQAIAFQFFCDYMDAVIESGADMTTLENTLEMLGKDLSLEQYNAYYSAFVDALDYKVTDGLEITITTPGKKTIEGLLKLMGQDVSSMSTYLGMVKEYKNNDDIVVSAYATMNAGREYCALILDAQASGTTNKFECIRKGNLAALNKQTSTLAGYSFIILLDDVNGDLTVSGTTILDLNGHNVEGTITSTGKLFIIDSSLDTYNAGHVEGVSGNVTVIAGNYSSDVSAFLKDGYYMDGTTVRNSMYYIQSDADGNVNYVLSGDVYKNLPSATAIALDMATELLLNYAISAGMDIDGNNIYDIKFEDLVGLLESNSKAADVADMLLEIIDFPGVSNMVNTLLDDMLNFGEIYTALENGKPIASYPVAISPWSVTVTRVENGDYLTLNIVPNDAMVENFTLSITVEGNSVNFVKDLAYELKDILDTDISVSITQPEREGKDVYISAAGSAIVTIDMSANEDYAIFFSIILAYGNADKREAVAAAINAGDMAGLKDVVDNTTVAQLFTALKKMSRNVGLKAMADTVGVTADISSAAELEEVYHLILAGTGKVLEELEITGMNKKLGNLYKEETGFYVLSKTDMFRDGELSARGYGANYEVTISELTFQVKLFGELEPPVEPDCEHNYVGVVTGPTCTEGGFTTYTCTLCGDSYVADFTDALGHQAGNWVTDEDYHWRYCQICNEVLDFAEHTWQKIDETADCTNSYFIHKFCTVCGETRSDEVAPTGHTYIEIVYEPTCTEIGYTVHYCVVCMDYYVDSYVEAVGHKYVRHEDSKYATCDEDGYVTYTCEYCGHSYTQVLPALGHNWSEWYEFVAPTCTEEGTMRRNCLRCGEVETYQVEALGHSYEAVVTAPTCVEGGYTTYTCSVCGDSYVADETEALGHSYELTESKAPTCSEDGYEVYTCSACGDSYTVVLVSNGHVYEAVVTAPTCTEGGYTTYTCSVCGDGYIADETEALGHAYEAVVTEPTCENGGYTTYTCANCGDSYVADETEALGHDLGEWYTEVDATCSANGTERRDCSRCDYFETREVVAFGHSYEAVVTAPTCTEQGFTTFTCPVCGDGYVGEYTDALGHAWGEWVVIKEAQCHRAGVTGLKERTCSVCGEVESAEIPTTDHVYVDGVCKWCGAEEGENPPTGMIAMGGFVFLLATAGMGCIVLFTRRKKLMN